MTHQTFLKIHGGVAEGLVGGDNSFYFECFNALNAITIYNINKVGGNKICTNVRDICITGLF